MSVGGSLNCELGRAREKGREGEGREVDSQPHRPPSRPSPLLFAMSSKRPPPSSANPTPPKRQRLSSTQTPTPSPEPPSSRFPPSASSLADLDREDDHPHPDSSEKYIPGHSSLAGTRRGTGSGVLPPTEEEIPPPEGEGARQVVEELEKDESTLQREKEEEERMIEEASKGVSIDDLELSDAKEVSKLVQWRKRKEGREDGRRQTCRS